LVQIRADSRTEVCDMSKRLVMYCREAFCPDQARARQLLSMWGVAYEEVNITHDRQAAERVQAWNGHLGMPTLVIAEEGSLEPITPPTPLAAGQQTRNLNRGTLISEPSERGLREFLHQHSLLQQPSAAAGTTG
jgi:glutaredoxin